MSEQKTNPKGLLHGDRFITVSTILVKPFSLRRLGPVNDGSNVHSSPGHGQLARRASYETYASMRLMLLLHILPRFAKLMSSRTGGGMLSALTSRVRNFALHHNGSYRVTLG
jgi:hypothetical protein